MNGIILLILAYFRLKIIKLVVVRLIIKNVTYQIEQNKKFSLMY